jgi:AraC family transcriptional regulator
MAIEIKEMPGMRVACVRHVGPYNEIGKAFDRLGPVVGPAGLFQQPGAAMIAIFHDDPDKTPPAELRSDAAVVVSENVQLPAGVTEGRIPAGRYACTLHKGTYEKLPEAWAQFKRELSAAGHRPAPGVSFEIYVNNPMTTAKEQLRTELYVPIAQ